MPAEEIIVPGEKLIEVVKIEEVKPVEEKPPVAAPVTVVKTETVVTPPPAESASTVSPNTFINFSDETYDFYRIPKFGSDTEFLAWLAALIIDAREARELRELREAREAREYREYLEARFGRETQAAAPVVPAPVISAPTEPIRTSSFGSETILDKIQVIPAMPDRFSGKNHNVQIGSYSSADTAARVAHQVKTAGFDLAYEQAGSNYRIIVMNIPAANLLADFEKLASIGFTQFWVRD